MVVPGPLLPVQSIACWIIFGIAWLLFIACAIYQLHLWRVAGRLTDFGVDEEIAIACVRLHGSQNMNSPYKRLLRAWSASGGNWQSFRPLRDQILFPFLYGPTALPV